VTNVDADGTWKREKPVGVGNPELSAARAPEGMEQLTSNHKKANLMNKITRLK
jgi:hypothetical protein